MLSWLLLMRLTVLNACGLAAAFYAYKLGFLSTLFNDGGSPTGYVVYAILAVFVEGLVYTFIRGFKVSRLINENKNRLAIDPARSAERKRAAEKLHAKQMDIHGIADTDLVTLGLIGTALGLIIVVLDPSISNEQLRPVLFAGLLIGLKATLAGFILSLWTHRNYRMLHKAVELYRVDVV